MTEKAEQHNAAQACEQSDEVELAPAIVRTLNVVRAVMVREVVRWWRARVGIIGALAFPISFLIVFGSGLTGVVGPLASTTESGEVVNYEQFIFPGILAMSVFFAAVFNSMSLIRDREHGVLKEMLVAPTSRAAIAVGKSLGGATVATLQGALTLIFAPLVQIDVSLTLLVKLVPLMFLGGLALSSVGVVAAARMRSPESFQVVNQFLIFPLIFLSGVFFPVRDLPSWMNLIVRLNPVSYAVDCIRRVVLEGQQLPDSILDKFADLGLGLSLFSRQLTILEEVAIVAFVVVVLNLVAMRLVSIRD